MDIMTRAQFEQSRSPRELRSHLSEIIGTWRLDDDIVIRLTDSLESQAVFVDDLFSTNTNNKDVYAAIQDMAQQLIGLGEDLSGLSLLWRATLELGEYADLVELGESPKIGAVVISGGNITVQCGDTSFTEPLGTGDHEEQAMKILRTL